MRTLKSANNGQNFIGQTVGKLRSIRRDHAMLVAALFLTGSVCIAAPQAGFLQAAAFALMAVWTAAIVERLNATLAFEKRVSQKLRERRTFYRRALNQAKSDAAAKSELLTIMSHELRTPMHGVLGFTGLLLQARLPRTQHKQVQLVHEAGQSMIQLLDNILSTAKLEATRNVAAFEAVEIRELVKNCLALHVANAEQKDIYLSSRFDAGVPKYLVSDGLRIRQVLHNLIGNAVKFTNNGAITVSAAIQNNMVVLGVKDSGVGIAPDRLEAIFERFVQAEGGSSLHIAGTGLGLPISRSVAEQLGGELVVHSEPGKGACFELRLPIIERRNQTQLDPPAAEEDDRRELVAGSNILLADDNCSNRILGAALLEQQELVVDTAENGEQAVARVMAAKAAGRPYDLVLMDVQMPECDGKTACATLRSVGIAADELPIIAFTADVFEADLKGITQSGMQGHLAKPLQADALLAVLKQWLPTAERLPDEQQKSRLKAA